MHSSSITAIWRKFSLSLRSSQFLTFAQPSPQEFIQKRVHSWNVARQRLPKVRSNAPNLREAPANRQQLRPDAQHINVLIPPKYLLQPLTTDEAVQQTLAVTAHPSVLLRPHVQRRRDVGDFLRKRKHVVREVLLAREPLHLHQPLTESVTSVARSGGRKQGAIWSVLVVKIAKTRSKRLNIVLFNSSLRSSLSSFSPQKASPIHVAVNWLYAISRRLVVPSAFLQQSLNVLVYESVASEE